MLRRDARVGEDRGAEPGPARSAADLLLVLVVLLLALALLLTRPPQVDMMLKGPRSCFKAEQLINGTAAGQTVQLKGACDEGFCEQTDQLQQTCTAMVAIQKGAEPLARVPDSIYGANSLADWDICMPAACDEMDSKKVLNNNFPIDQRKNRVKFDIRCGGSSATTNLALMLLLILLGACVYKNRWRAKAWFFQERVGMDGPGDGDILPLLPLLLAAAALPAESFSLI